MVRKSKADKLISEAMTLLSKRRISKMTKDERVEMARTAGLGNRNRDPEEMSATNRANALRKKPQSKSALKRRGLAIKAAWARKRAAAAEEEQAEKRKRRPAAA